jgi:hypothetical protein
MAKATDADRATKGEPPKMTSRQIRALGAIVQFHLQERGGKPLDLLKICEIDPYGRERSGEPDSAESSRYITRLIVSGSAQFANAFAQAFRVKILTARYCKDLPLSVVHAIHETFPDFAQNGFFKKNLERSQARTSPLMFINRFANYDPVRIDEMTREYVGLWQVIRYSHLGDRVVRAVLEILAPNMVHSTHPFPIFNIHFRTHSTTGNEKVPPYKTSGCLVPMKSAQHMMFLGVEDTEHPLTIASKTRVQPGGAVPSDFYGIVQRHHIDDNKFFAMPTAFVRTKTMPIEKYPANKIGSWSEELAVKLMSKDVPKCKEILGNLRRRRGGDGRAGLIVSGD